MLRLLASPASENSPRLSPLLRGREHPGVSNPSPSSSSSSSSNGTPGLSSATLLHPSRTPLTRPSSSSSSSSCFLSRAAYHHSSELQRYFTNRFHKKICPRCSRPNILPACCCCCCQQQLSDLHIHPVGKDPLCELVLSRHRNHDASSFLLSRLSDSKQLPDSEVPYLSLEAFLNQSPKPLGGHPGVPPGSPPGGPPWGAPGGAPGESVGFCELFRSFKFVVSVFPFSAAFVHLVGVPKASIYDLKQLRRSHLGLLLKMKEKTELLVGLLVDLHLKKLKSEAAEAAAKAGVDGGADTPEAGCWGVRTPGEAAPGRNAGEQKPQLSKELNELKTKEINSKLKQMTVFGFNYPAEFSQLCMHALTPPFSNFSLFQFPFFYPFNKVAKDLQSRGAVQVVPAAAAAAAAALSEDDSAVQTVKERDAAARQLLLQLNLK
ncbi:Pv1h14035_P, related, related [Eimeria tenella]|uniref:Pv1h14035_P, related, related n=1 Tax=Eimeria tenella TaxID=5802 RepID=U6KQY9_EIMTE|nr:Pv1h14035_P, related, related [Eimeria tenella]CDJ40517.1 Pv1h14035_P, related, related [Eimeria tenella]|eukprot:XP_013231267.1 Pv1h14035_P, related, related [Eimeria tenella]